ncbi:hypothetical protein AMTRI_Chr03g148180 [Amborella trichopoda]|uniref:F-box associated domain-containing protein n=1 Tax=Amborella trichopoda TaxID=13333 RepID=W1NV26_AMBTC|nr:hypothetical protein AMTR_s00002p00269900 [Amborella trichopoda]
MRSSLKLMPFSLKLKLKLMEWEGRVCMIVSCCHVEIWELTKAKNWEKVVYLPLCQLQIHEFDGYIVPYGRLLFIVEAIISVDVDNQRGGFLRKFYWTYPLISYTSDLLYPRLSPFTPTF